MYRIGVDVGGTFTDLVAVDDAGRVSLAKSASTPADPSVGVMDGLGLLAAELGTDLPGLLGTTGLIVHGTTVATNALLERKGGTVGMLTTAGHRDIIEMREGLKDDRYNLRMAPPVPLVPRARRLDVTERLRFDGTVETRLSRSSAEAAIRRLDRAGVTAVAVCYLHSYRDPRHERRRAGCSRGSCRTPTSRSPPTCSPRSRSTSASAPRWSTRTWAPCSGVTWAASAHGCGSRATRATC
jgi:N-methylhydantoinase A